MNAPKERISLSTGKPYPKCVVCKTRTVYTDGLCWMHWKQHCSKPQRRKE